MQLAGPEVFQVMCPRCNRSNRVIRARLERQPHCGHCHEPLFTGEPLALTAETFERQTVQGDLPVVVEFGAAWCGPCRVMAPVFQQAARHVEPFVRLAKIDAAAESALTQQQNVGSLPTLVIYRHGRELARQSGALPLRELLAWVGRHLELERLRQDERFVARLG